MNYLDPKNKQRHNPDETQNMEILRKFRYNFHYWLKNCYQNPDSMGLHPDAFQDNMKESSLPPANNNALQNSYGLSQKSSSMNNRQNEPMSSSIEPEPKQSPFNLNNSGKKPKMVSPDDLKLPEAIT